MLRSLTSLLFAWMLMGGLAGCGPKLLDQHVFAANDFRLASDQALAPLRAFCPSSEASPECARVYDAQHAYVDAHVAFVLQLHAEADANRWRHPDDHRELVALCVAYRAYADAADAIDVQLTALPPRAAALCMEVR